MIIIKAQGGLGNQMFQYALYKRLKQEGKKVKMNITPYITYKLHNGFELEKIFNVKIDYATKEEIFSSIFEEYIDEYELNRNCNFSKEILEIDNGYLNGYWQMESYFKSIRTELLEDYKITINDEKNIEILEKIEHSSSVSIHIRRGDYLSDPNLCEMATVDYYRKAINIIKEKIKNPMFFIFSDDVEWIKNNFNIDNSIIIDFNKNEESYRDMFLMSRCKHNIIANSSFSWWGAWLNTNHEKIVIRPAKWMKRSNIGDDVGSCDTWIECDVLNNIDINKINIEEKSIMNHKSYVDKEIWDFLSVMFGGNEQSFIKSLKGKEHKYIYYFSCRVAIVEKDNEEIKKNFDKFIESMDDSLDLNKYISLLFHFGKYKYDVNRLEEAKLIFEKINDISGGQHKTAKKYLLELNF